MPVVPTRSAVLAGAVALATLVAMAPASAAPASSTHVASASGAAPKVKTARVCSAPRNHRLECFAIRQVDPVQPAGLRPEGVTPNVTPSGYGPADLRGAYALTASGSSAQTVAIVDAYDDPNAESDLATYRSQYGIPACATANGCFKKINQNGATSPLPTADSGWAGEISLDVDMVSAICPNCHILLVEANSASTANLGTAVNRAVTLGAKFVSNSYGGSEYSGETTDENSYFNHPGVAITASTGDDGNGTEFPATSRYVTAVGGTSLVRNSSSVRGWSETAWSGAGSGCSSYVTKPTFQNGVSTNCTRRAEADVSAVADPNTGVAVYQTYGGSGWAVYGGTSASSPIVASVYALAGNPGTSDAPNAYPYAHPASLNDVTSGTNGSCGAPLCTAGTGWDGPTGLGTPKGTAAFASGGGGTTGPTVANPGNKTGTVGTATSFTVTASGGTTPYTWSATGLPPGIGINASSGVVSGTPTTVGTYTSTVTATGGGSGSATFTFTVNPSGGGCAGAGQKLGNPGFESGAVTWSASNGVIGQNGSAEPTHGGTWDAWLDGYGTTHTDTLSQSVTVPAGCTNSTLSFFLHIDTAETTTTTAYDKLTVKIGSTTLATYSNLNKATGYTQRSFAVGAYAGSTITVSFTGTEDGSLQTSFVVDDTALTAS